MESDLLENKNALGVGSSKAALYSDYKLFAFSPDTKTKTKKFSKDQKAMRDLRMIYSKDGTLKIAGFYMDFESNTRRNGIDGYMYQKLDPLSLETIEMQLNDFSSSEIYDFLVAQGQEDERESVKIERKLDKEKDVRIEDFYLLDIFEDDNQAIMLVAEDFDIQQTTTNNFNGANTRGLSRNQTQTFYINGDLAFLNINDTGELLALKNHYKYQSSARADWGTTKIFQHNNRLHFVYNHSDERSFSQMNFSHSYLDLHSFKIKTYSITNEKERYPLKNFIMEPGKNYLSSDGELIGIAPATQTISTKRKTLFFRLNLN